MVLTSWRSLWCGVVSWQGNILAFWICSATRLQVGLFVIALRDCVEKVRNLFDAHVEEPPIVSLLFYSGSTCSIMVLPSVLSCDFTSLFMTV